MQSMGVETLTSKKSKKGVYYNQQSTAVAFLYSKKETEPMLPDLPSLKRDIQKRLDRYLKMQVDARLGAFREAPRHAINEGNRMRLVRADGSIEESELQKASVEMSLKLTDVPELTLEKRLTMLNEKAEEMAHQISTHLFGRLNEAVTKTGQVVDQKGKPLDPDAIFAMLEKLQMDFDETGMQNKLSFIMPPAVFANAKHVFEQIESDPELQERHREIMQRKRMEWRDREAARKLVG